MLPRFMAREHAGGLSFPAMKDSTMKSAKEFVVAAACLCFLVMSTLAGAQVVQTADITVDVSDSAPLIVLNNLNFGNTYLAVNRPTGPAATATVSPTMVLTNAPGIPGNARLVPIDTGTPNTLRITITGGIPNATMDLGISDDNTGQPFMIMTGQTTPGDAVFRVDTWTPGIVAPSQGTVVTFNGTTGLGVVNLGPGGEIDVRFGATMRTVPSALAYSAQSYLGTIRVTVDY